MTQQAGTIVVGVDGSEQSEQRPEVGGRENPMVG